MVGVSDELAARVAALEDRVTALEEPAPHAEPAGAFWALDGLRARSEGAGTVLFTGTATLPDERHYDWQQSFAVADLIDREWAEAADVFAALGHPVRLTLLREVLRGTGSAADLAETAGLGTTGQLYHHLRQLVAAGWLRSPARGRYEVPAGRVVALLVVLAAGGA